MRLSEAVYGVMWTTPSVSLNHGASTSWRSASRLRSRSVSPMCWRRDSMASGWLATCPTPRSSFTSTAATWQIPTRLPNVTVGSPNPHDSWTRSAAGQALDVLLRPPAPRLSLVAGWNYRRHRGAEPHIRDTGWGRRVADPGSGLLGDAHRGRDRGCCRCAAAAA